MTQEERYKTSIKILSALRDDVAKHPDVGESVFNADRYVALTDALEALESRSEAEEYRTPKKIVHFKYTDGSVDDLCPICRCVLIPHFTSFCSNCGQALDWSEVEI